jgi:hypothetical protein
MRHLVDEALQMDTDVVLFPRKKVASSVDICGRTMKEN